MKARLWLVLSLLWGCASATPTGSDLGEVRQEIHRLTNALRVEMHLPPLAELPELSGISERYSQDMARRQFFDHTDPEGKTPYDRLKLQAPQLLCASSGENILKRSRTGQSASELAQTLFGLWRESPEHYAHLISPDFWQLGVGLSQEADVVYATQTFAAAVVALTEPLPERVTEGDTLSLNFRFLAPFPAEELTAFLQAPDPFARIEGADGRSYLGKGPIGIRWQGDRAFRVEIPVRYGLGAYQLKLGRKGAYYNAPYRFEGVRP
ncbi:MAG: CAP domain-containing protein [Candidatus Sericytochromatia bacterium]